MKIENKDMPAMPSEPIDTKESEWETGGGRYVTSNGLTKREHFAAMAIQGFCSRDGYSSFDDMACDAVRAADTLLEELGK